MNGPASSGSGGDKRKLQTLGVAMLLALAVGVGIAVVKRESSTPARPARPAPVGVQDDWRTERVKEEPQGFLIVAGPKGLWPLVEKELLPEAADILPQNKNSTLQLTKVLCDYYGIAVPEWGIGVGKDGKIKEGWLHHRRLSKDSLRVTIQKEDLVHLARDAANGCLHSSCNCGRGMKLMELLR